MKTYNLWNLIIAAFTFLIIESCGPVIISSHPSHPMPGWFYPNRVINVRYVYFPEYTIYYDLTLRNYLYLNNGVWVRVSTLPPRYNHINFRHAKQIRVDNYFDDNIRAYHNDRRGSVSDRRSNDRGRRNN
ncbi:hypothetical protein V8G61_03065 [Gaetbulibacter sp. M240]|uniref:hypothetical protein n=1 Tax=Gaetbulibacter sp. M240 TaxID=3126511 RepID=UPI00374F173A